MYAKKSGKGKIINVTTLLGYGCHGYAEANPSELLYDLCGAPATEWKKDLPYGVCVDNVDGTDLWVAYSEEDRELEFTLPWKARDEFGTAKVTKKGFALPPRGIAVLRKTQ